VLALAAGRDGSVLAGTSVGAFRIPSDGGPVIPLIDGVPGAPAEQSVFGLAEAADGTLWIGTDREVSRRDPMGQWRRLVEIAVQTMVMDRGGRLWVGTAASGVLRIHGNRVERLDRRQGLPDDRVRAILEDSTGGVWLGTNAGLVVLRDLPFRGLTARQGLAGDYARSVLELLAQARHPLALVTKGSGVERDLDLLAPMGRQGLAAVYVTVTTLDAKLARILEPRAAAVHRRLRTIRALAEAGVPTGVSVSPQIPFINDDMEQVLKAAYEAGARRAFYQVLRLPWELSPMFRQWLELHYPDRAARVMARVQDLHGGRDYRADFATRMKGRGAWADLLRQRFDKTCARLGFNRDRTPMDSSRFRPSALRGQAELF